MNDPNTPQQEESPNLPSNQPKDQSEPTPIGPSSVPTQSQATTQASQPPGQPVQQNTQPQQPVTPPPSAAATQQPTTGEVNQPSISEGPKEPKKSGGKPIITIILIIVAAIVLLCGGSVFAYYYFFVGITPKQKYEKCAKTCEDIMLLEGDIPACRLRCEEISGYSPSEGETSDSSSRESQSSSSTSTKDDEDREYYCEWSWPQKIIDKDTKEVIKACTYSQPYCNYADGTYENVGCCSDFVNEKHVGCTTLADL